MLLSLIIYGFLMVGLVTLNGIFIAMTLPFIVFLAAGYLYTPANPELTLRRTFSERYVNPEKDVEVTLAITNQGRDQQEILIEDQIPKALELVDGETQLLTVVPPGQEVSLVYTVRGQRGGFAFRPVTVTVYDHLGLFTKQIELDAPGQILVKPDVNRLRPLAIRPPRTHGFTGAIPGRQGGSGTSFYGVREYQMGDPQRRINWKSTARYESSIYTNEFERERVADVGLVLDARQRTDVVTPNGTLFEYGVSATAALADMFLQSGNRVGMLIYGRGQETTFPGYGKVQREKILRALAHAATGDNLALESFTYIPTRLFPARSQLIIISPLFQDDLPVLARLRSYGYQILIVSPNPVTFEAQAFNMSDSQPLPVRLASLERQVLLRRLQRAGITVVDWSVDQPFGQAFFTAVGRSSGQVTRGGFHL
jgi:uncharacterized protein (DUF58 family)